MLFQYVCIRCFYRFSPKPSPLVLQQMEEDERRAHSPGPKIKKLNRISRRTDEKQPNQPKSKNGDGKFTYEKNAFLNSAKRNIYNSPKSVLGRTKESPHSSLLKNKMKKLKSNIKKNKDQNLSWFDADNIFGFDGQKKELDGPEMFTSTFILHYCLYKISIIINSLL